MIKQTIIISSVAILLNMIVNIDYLRCQEIINTLDIQYQSKYIEKITKGFDEDNLKDDKNIGVKILELIIKHNLHCEYQKVDSKELEDRLERGW